MVIQHGRSGAEKDLICLARQAGIFVEELDEIDLLLKEVTGQYEEQRSKIFEHI